MKKLTQKDLCVMFLADYNGWIESYKLNGRSYKEHFLGAQSDKRMIEIFDGVADQPGKSVQYEIDGREYLVETKKDRGIRMYKATQTKYKIIKRAVLDEKTFTVRVEEVKI